MREANTDLQQQLVHVSKIKQTQKDSKFQERTEEKKKIFELAGGGQKKRFGFGRSGKNAQQRKPGQYLPEVEQKRREPWRQYHGVSLNLLLIFRLLFRQIMRYHCAHLMNLQVH